MAVETTARAPARPRRLALERSSIGAALLGAATVAGFAPFDLYPLPIVTIALLVYLWNAAASPRRAAALGWWFGLGFFLAGVSWVYVSLHTFGAMAAPLAAIATLLFCAFLAVFPAAAAYVYARVPVAQWAKLTLILPAAWTLSEWVRGWIFTGFPWIALGYSQVPSSPLAGYAPIVGVYGLTLAVVLTAGLIVLVAERARALVHAAAKTSAEGATHALGQALGHPAAVALLALWLGGFGLAYVQWTQPAGEPITVTALQGNIPQDIKWTPEGLRTTLVTYQRLALESKAKLIVFPETALPLFLHQVPSDYLETLAAHARKNGGDVLIGVPERLPTGEYFNSVISVGASKPQAYRKTHLVPFGEFIPLRPVLGWIVNTLAIPLQDFSRGAEDPKPLAIAGQRVAPNVCYEDAFGEEIIRQLPEATLLVNVSNVAWFGRSIAPRQHLQISQARALETGRYMVRATNTGMTAIVDQRGRVAKLAPEFATAAVTGKVQGYTGATPYVRWGNGFILAICALLIAAAVLLARGSRGQSR
ncbi:MAG TPA: apolipoprotein N-acyltransferase [Burkholderiales bacterium]|nr:apolipoprotein N-acyltransferase [Burkholderiales bacterium]